MHAHTTNGGARVADFVCTPKSACDARMQLYTQWISKAQQQNDPNGAPSFPAMVNHL